MLHVDVLNNVPYPCHESRNNSTSNKQKIMKVEWLLWLLMLTKKNSAFSRNIHTPFTLDSISYTSMEKNKKGKKKKKKKKIFTIL